MPIGHRAQMAEQNEQEAAAAATANRSRPPTQEELWAAVGPLVLPAKFSNWVVLQQEPFRGRPIGEYQWANRRIAHKWDNGWDFATFRSTQGETHWLYYQSVRRELGHALPLELYGQDNVWVVIAKEGS